MGFTFEDFHTGDLIDLGSTVVDRQEMLAFARRFDPQPFHVDEDAARGSLLGGLCASGWFTCSLWMRAYVDTVLANSSSQGSPGGKEISWPTPVFPGDELTFRVGIGPTRRSASRPGLGLVEMTATAWRGETLVLRSVFTGIFSAGESASGMNGTAG